MNRIRNRWSESIDGSNLSAWLLSRISDTYRRVRALVALVRMAFPFSSKPSRTCKSDKSGTIFPKSSSKPTIPLSTTCIAATAVTSFVNEAIQHTDSSVNSSFPSNLRDPDAEEQIVLPDCVQSTAHSMGMRFSPLTSFAFDNECSAQHFIVFGGCL